eukprot:1190366-Prorocentrum_minimum.AAC.4
MNSQLTPHSIGSWVPTQVPSTWPLCGHDRRRATRNPRRCSRNCDRDSRCRLSFRRDRSEARAHEVTQ